MLFFNQDNFASLETELENRPTTKKGSPLPIPKHKARSKPYIKLAFATANDNKSNKGAADVPKLKINP